MLVDNFFKERDNLSAIIEHQAKELKKKYSSVIVIDGKHHAGGKDLELNEHTLTLQFITPTQTAAAFRLAGMLYNLKFDNSGKALDKQGLPMNEFENKDHLLEHKGYEFVRAANGEYLWREDGSQSDFTTEQLVKSWVKLLVDRAG